MKTSPFASHPTGRGALLLSALLVLSAGCSGEPCLRPDTAAPTSIQVAEGPGALEVSCAGQPPQMLPLTTFTLSRRLVEGVERHSLHLTFGAEASGQVKVMVELPREHHDGTQDFEPGQPHVEVSLDYLPVASGAPFRFGYTSDLPGPEVDLEPIPEETLFSEVVDLTLELDDVSQASSEATVCRDTERTIRLGRTVFRLEERYRREVCYDAWRIGGH